MLSMDNWEAIWFNRKIFKETSPRVSYDKNGHLLSFDFLFLSVSKGDPLSLSFCLGENDSPCATPCPLPFMDQGIRLIIPEIVCKVA